MRQTTQSQTEPIAWSLLSLLLLGHFPTVVDHLDEAGKILVAAAAVDEALVKLLGFPTHRRIGADAARSVFGKLQVLQHQGSSEPAFIIVIGRRFRTDAGDGAIARHRPALARGLGGNVEEGLEI